MADDFTLEEVCVPEITQINKNFLVLKDAISQRVGGAKLNGDSTEKFQVADAVDAMDAVNKEQLDGSVATINSEIAKVETEIETKADKAYVDTNLALKANKSDVDASLVTKLDASDATVTKQGNTFNSAGQLVRLDVNGKLPAADGSLLTGIVAGADKDLSNITTNAKSNLNNTGIRTVVDTYVNGTSWYRVYSDGWIEQGGYYLGLGQGIYILTLLKSFTNTNYTFLRNQYSLGSGGSSGYYCTGYTAKTASTVSIPTDSTGYTAGYSWFACGY